MSETGVRLTLTVAEIYDLACMAGFVINHAPEAMPDAGEMETEITIIECPVGGVLGDHGERIHTAHIAYLEDYPDEGVATLGREVANEPI